MKEPKAKAFLLTFQALFTNDKNDNEEEDESNDKQDGDADNNQEVDDDVQAFLSLVGSLKELAVDFLVFTSALSTVKSKLLFSTSCLIIVSISYCFSSQPSFRGGLSNSFFQFDLESR
jgi:hypothetical protein